MHTPNRLYLLVEQATGLTKQLLKPIEMINTTFISSAGENQTLKQIYPFHRVQFLLLQTSETNFSDEQKSQLAD